MNESPLSIHQVKLVVKPVDFGVQSMALSLIKDASIFVGTYRIRDG